jgi:hypothetical protein
MVPAVKPVFSEASGGAAPRVAVRARGWWARLRREPLLLFAIIGALLLAADRLTGASQASDDNPQLIAVDRDTLLRFLQYRSKVFSEQGVGQSFDAMSAAERRRLIDSYVREEALYREALSWGLDKEDYVIRRRLVQSLEFALQDDPAAASVGGDEAALRGFYKANPQLYARSPTISFSHAFFRRGTDAAPRAEAALAAIRSGRADPATLGDRFLYNASYAGQSLDAITRDFGERFAAALFATRNANGWIGPIESEQGVHLVQIVGSEAGGIPTFEQVRDKVAADAAEELRRQRQEAALQRIIAQYRVTIAPGLR